MERVDYQPLIVQDLVNWDQHNELNLKPWYQRRSVWTPPQRAYLLNTLFEQKPIPTLYFRHSVDLEQDKSLREVVDGQQRIRAILDYVKNEFGARHPEHNNKVKYEQLTTTQKHKLRETKLSGGWLLGATDADVIEVFGRLNSVAKTLNEQEKRNAVFSGEFKQFCLREAATRVSLWRDLGIFSANDIARMQEVEFVSDIVLNFIKGLSDFKPSALDQIYRENDEDFPNSAKVAKRLESCFSRIAALPASTIRDTIFCRKPIFFSLLVVLDEKKDIKGAKLEKALIVMDEKFNSDKPITQRTREDADFFEACSSSTQRIASRRIRNNYINRYLR
jgi:hypothetical protein